MPNALIYDPLSILPPAARRRFALSQPLDAPPRRVRGSEPVGSRAFVLLEPFDRAQHGRLACEHCLDGWVARIGVQNLDRGRTHGPLVVHLCPKCCAEWFADAALGEDGR